MQVLDFYRISMLYYYNDCEYVFSPVICAEGEVFCIKSEAVLKRYTI